MDETTFHIESAVASDAASSVSDAVFHDVFRLDFDAPGFALLTFGADTKPRDIRALMVDLKSKLSLLLTARGGGPLHYLSMGRFDQQATTKFHLDGAPAESVLMLGYEPSVVRSRLFIADYSKCAHDHSMNPRTYLNDFNPMFTSGATMLNGYITELQSFDHSRFNVLLINNSSADYQKGMQGVMHKAEIVSPDPDRTRIVNSTMTFVNDVGRAEPIGQSQQQTFVESDIVSPRLA